jgi:TonB family protein
MQESRDMLDRNDVARQSGDNSVLILVLSALLIVLFVLAGYLSVATAQTYEQSGDERKVISRVEPEYPDALKKLYIGGVVRVEVVVLPNGTVKSTKLLGGSPILGQSTMKAIRQWKYVPGTEETLTVKVDFDPHR